MDNAIVYVCVYWKSVSISLLVYYNKHHVDSVQLTLLYRQTPGCFLLCYLAAVEHFEELDRRKAAKGRREWLWQRKHLGATVTALLAEGTERSWNNLFLVFEKKKKNRVLQN